MTGAKHRFRPLQAFGLLPRLAQSHLLKAPIALGLALASPRFHLRTGPWKMLDCRHADAAQELAMQLERSHHPRPVAEGADDSARTTEIPPMSSLFILTFD